MDPSTLPVSPKKTNNVTSPNNNQAIDTDITHSEPNGWKKPGSDYNTGDENTVSPKDGTITPSETFTPAIERFTEAVLRQKQCDGFTDSKPRKRSIALEGLPLSS